MSKGRYHDLFARHLRVTSYTPSTLMALCPFHGDTDSSLSVDTRRGLWHCFGCGLGGGHKAFQERLGDEDSYVPPPDLSSLADLLKTLAEPVVPLDLTDQVKLDGFGAARVWMEERGIGPEQVERWELGYDTMAQRLTMPVRSWSNRLLGIIHRKLRDDESPGPRYKYPARFSKKDNLYGIHLVTDDKVALVEGPIDAIAMDALGIPAVAILGSHLAKGQIELLERAGVKDVTVCFDGDRAGAQASKQAVGDLRDSRVIRTVRKVTLPKGADPDSLTPSQAERLRQWWANGPGEAPERP